MPSRFKILVLADSRSFHTGRYVNELRRQGCRVLLASLEKGTELQFTLKRRGAFRVFDYVAAAMEIRALVKRFRPDAINPHFASGYGFAVALAGVRKSVPVVLQLWGSDILIVPQKSILHRWKTCFSLRRADCVIGDSDYVLHRAEALAVLKRRKTIVWGIEEEFLAHSKTDFQVSKPLKIIVPRPHEEVYNNLFLLEALAPLINERKISVTFPDFGGGVAGFRSKANEMCGDRVQFYPKKTRREFMAFLAGHDLYLSGALSDSSPVSLLEAMGLGLIPVAADIPGVREWLNPESGFTYDTNNEDSLRRIIVKVIEKCNSFDRMKTSNIARVQKEAIFENNIAGTIDVMRDLAGKGPA
jgi:glycosyltransferase involved in cell wall biosynthesis